MGPPSEAEVRALLNGVIAAQQAYCDDVETYCERYGVQALSDDVSGARDRTAREIVKMLAARTDRHRSRSLESFTRRPMLWPNSFRRSRHGWVRPRNWFR